ncbi:pilus assembly protein [Hyphomonas sp.]|uniref:vWA domain-containing protein n=1 Tax=Hyphomonas sp. TaxID=87 RepID=UPI001BCC1C0D|nr:pilus assembly protein [Hyphomonas sp.]
MDGTEVKMKTGQRNIFKGFAANESGNVAMIAALTIIPIVTIAGFAIDFQVTTTQKARVQQAIDSAVLAATKSMQDGKDKAYTLKEANDYFTGILNQSSHSGLTCTKIDLIYIDATEEMEGRASCEQKTTLSQVAGIQKLEFDVASAATYGIGKLEIAFVFDVSGSMGSNNRMTDLKAAARDAVDTLLPVEGYSGDPEDVRLAMVSYDTMVNAGPYFKAVTNVDPTRTYSYYGSIYQATTCRRRNWRGQCTQWNYAWSGPHSRSHTITSTCVWEREGADRYTGRGPANNRWLTPITATFNNTNDSWRVDSAANPNCNSDIPVPLTHDREKLLDFIDGMRPVGMTAGHIGTAWGWYLVSPDFNTVWPSGSKALPYDEPDATKVVIMMSDGAYNQTRPGSGNPSSTTQARAVCDQMKANDIVIYTVAFSAPTAGQEVLAYCATNPAFAFKPSNGQELTEAYKSIARSISDLRISR